MLETANTQRRIICKDTAPLDPGVPPEVIVPVWLGLPSDQFTPEDSGIIIADFGEAFEPQVTWPFTAHTPLLIAPPESRFTGPGGADLPLSFPGDIWTLACTVWDVFGCGPPFEAFPVTLDEVTIEQVEMLGKLPERLWRKWEGRGNWFDENGCKNVKEDLRLWYGNSAIDWDERFVNRIQRPQEKNEFDAFSIEEANAFCKR